MTCDEEALTEYLDGELDPERRGAVEAHLKSCAACAKTLGRLEAASAAFRKHGAVPPPSRGLGTESRGRTQLWSLAGAALSASCVMLVLGKMFKPQISSIYNQSMGMISGAASTVGSGEGGGPVAGDDSSLIGLGVAAALVFLVFAYRTLRGR